MSDKQRATFDSIIGFRAFGDRGISVMLAGVKGHPRLGTQAVVTTSRVTGIEYDDNRIIAIATRNTTYTRKVSK